MNTRIKEFHHIIRATDPRAPYTVQIEDVLDKVVALSESRKIFFIRIFLSDSANQQDFLVQAMADRGLTDASIIQQPPLDGSKVAAWLWTVEGDLNPVYIHQVSYNLVSDASGSMNQMA